MTTGDGVVGRHEYGSNEYPIKLSVKVYGILFQFSISHATMFQRAHHVALIVSDYERSKDFYCRILQLPIIRETFRADRESYKLDLQLKNGMQIELFSFPNPPSRPSRPEACGLRHLAFEVDDLDAVIRYLQDEGVAVEAVRLDHLTGRRFTFFADPDGLPLELYEAAELQLNQ